jgi:hypothetical protein
MFFLDDLAGSFFRVVQEVCFVQRKEKTGLETVLNLTEVA